MSEEPLTLAEIRPQKMHTNMESMLQFFLTKDKNDTRWDTRELYKYKTCRFFFLNVCTSLFIFKRIQTNDGFPNQINFNTDWCFFFYVFETLVASEDLRMMTFWFKNGKKWKPKRSARCVGHASVFFKLVFIQCLISLLDNLLMNFTFWALWICFLIQQVV